MYVVISMVFPVLMVVESARSQIRNSVYSMFGVGEFIDNNVGMNRSLGGTGIALQSGRSINYLNPASYLGLPENSFVLEVGLYGLRSTSESRSDFQTDNDINLSYGSISAYLAKGWGLSFGILPFSYVKYEVKAKDDVEGDLTSFEKTFRGSGGLSRIYLGNSFRILDNLAAGLNISYIGGPITESESVPAGGILSSYELETYRTVSAFYVDFGLQYFLRNDSWLCTIGLIYGPSRRLNTEDSLQLVVNETVTPLEYSERQTISIPQSFGFGLSVTKGNIRAGFDFEWKNWKAVDFSNHFFETRNSTRYAVGMEYFPGREEKSSQKAFTYRLGANHKNSYLEIDNVAVNSLGVNIGVGIPFDVVYFNASIEYGQAGTMSKGLTRSRYWLFYLSMSLSELWSPITFED